MSSTRNVAELLQDYLQSLTRGSAEAAVALFDERALFELPFLKPNRLVGRDEIRNGHEALLATLEAVAFEPASVAHDATHAIAEGTLEFSRAGDEPRRLGAGIVAEMRDGRLLRLSVYCDARNVRPWCDEAIL